MGTFRKIDPAVKEEIIQKIKKEGLSVSSAAKDYNVSNGTIYAWIGSKGTVEPGALEVARLRRENQELKMLIGSLTLNMERGKKNY